MDVSTPDREWLQAVVARAVLVGAGIGAVGIGGSALVLASSGGGMLNAAVLISTVLLALAVGVWAGGPDARRERLPLRERWISAAAILAVAGSFATFSSLYQQLYPGPWWIVALLLINVAVPSYALGFLPPLLLTWAERTIDPGDDNTFTWGGLGPLVIGMLFGAALASLLIGIVALPRWGAGTPLMTMALLLLVALTLRDPATSEPNEALLFETVTPLGSLRVTEVVYPGERQPERRLYLNDEEEAGELVRSGAPTLAYVAAAENWLGKITGPGASYLFLGGGAYTLPRRIAERDPSARITVVERDPEVTRIAYRLFGVHQRHRISTITGDARAYLDSHDGSRFDRIYIDVYAGNETLPFSLVTAEAAAGVARRLTPGGVAALNIIGTVRGPESRQLWSIVRSYAEVFPTLQLYTHLGSDFPDRQNLLLTVTLDDGRGFPQVAGHFETWPSTDWPPMEGSEVLRDLMLPPEYAAASGEHGQRA